MGVAEAAPVGVLIGEIKLVGEGVPAVVGDGGPVGEGVPIEVGVDVPVGGTRVVEGEAEDAGVAGGGVTVVGEGERICAVSVGVPTGSVAGSCLDPVARGVSVARVSGLGERMRSARRNHIVLMTADSPQPSSPSQRTQRPSTVRINPSGANATSTRSRPDAWTTIPPHASAQAAGGRWRTESQNGVGRALYRPLT